jgi:competence protein ComEC
MPAGPSSIGHSVDGRASTGLANLPLFHAAWLFAAGIIVAHFLWIRPSLALVALIPLAVLCGVAALRAQRIAWLPLALLWALLGAWCAEVEPHPAPASTILALSDGLLRTVEGTVVNSGPVRLELDQNIDEPSLNAPTQRLDVRVASIEQVNDQTDTQIPADGIVRITVRWPAGSPQPFACGDSIRADARPLQPETYHDPGAWSRADYLLGQGITSTATVNSDRITRTGSATPSFACRLGALQQSATTRLLSLPTATRHLPAPLRLSTEDAVMLAAMVAGDRTYLSHSLRVGFERTGSFHMLVVSGFHLAIVAGCLFWIARRLRLPRVPATLLTIFASLAYALFTGFATPVQRSFWMVTLYLIGRLFYRDRSPLNVIGFAALCLLVASPSSLFESGFQMTLLAVVSIAGIAAPLLQATVHPYSAAARELRLVAIDAKLPPPHAAFRVAMRMIAMRLRRFSNSFIAWRAFPWSIRFLIRVVELVVVSVVVELAMALSMAIDFHRITIFALPVNLFILPLLAVLMPAALLTLLALLLWPPIAIVPGSVVALVLHAGVGLVHLFGSMRFGDVRIATPTPIQAAAFWLLVAAAIALAAHGASRPWLRRAAFLALLLAACASVAPRPIERPRNALLVQAIDVGQGDSLLLITPDGKTLLVDAGGFGGGPRQASQEFDIGEEVVSVALWSRGIRHLDAVALSHAHSDHMGGMPAILRNFHPDELWVGDNPPVAPYSALLDEAASLHTRVRTFRSGDAFAFGSTQVAVLAPTGNYHPGAEPANDDSLVLHMTYGSTSVMLEGDAEEPVENAMLAEAMLAGSNLKSTLLKVGHHGSLTSTSPAFLARVAPQWAVVSAGPHNRYGHPRPEILSELERARARTFRTDIDGASCFLLDGKTATTDDACGWRPVP